MLALLFAVAPLFVQLALAQGPPNCADAGNCEADTPFELAMIPYTLLVGPMIYPLFWGVALFLIQLASHTTMLTGMVGTVIAFAFVGSDAYTHATSATFFYYGYLLVGISIGITLFSMIKGKVHTG